MPANKYLSGNALVCGDNMDVLKELPDDCIDLIYLDPPFNSNQFYVAAFGDKGMVAQQLKDVWRWTVETQNSFDRLPHGKLLDSLRGIRLQAGEKSQMAAYCVYMGRRLEQLRRVLKPNGSIYLHCDPHANAFLRILMDTIFGEKQFKNEIVWFYRKWTNAASHFQRNHDTIYAYSKGTTWTFNKQFDPNSPQAAKYKRGWDVNRVGKGVRQLLVYDRQKAADKIKNGDYDVVVYREDSRAAAIPDVWEIPIINSQAEERVGYPTQKPLALLERIIKASSNGGDLMLDPFCGCGTAADAAAKLGRGYLGIDISAMAVRVMEQRLASRGGAATPVVYGLDWGEADEWEEFERQALRSRDDAEDGVPGWAWAEDRVAGILNAIPNQRKVGDGGVDARYYGVMDIKREKPLVLPIQVKMHRNAASVGRPDMDRLLGSQTAMVNRGEHAPMSLMISLYPPPRSLQVFAAEQGRVTINTSEEGGVEYPVMQVLSVQEILQKGERPKLPPVDPRSLVGNTQTRLGAG